MLVHRIPALLNIFTALIHCIAAFAQVMRSRIQLVMKRVYLRAAEGSVFGGYRRLCDPVAAAECQCKTECED
jgi:hypothetical protein